MAARFSEVPPPKPSSCLPLLRARHNSTFKQTLPTHIPRTKCQPLSWPWPHPCCLAPTEPRSTEGEVSLPTAFPRDPEPGGIASRPTPIRRYLHKEAVGSREHPLGVDQRAPTNVGAAIVQADLPRPLALWGQRTPHDPPGHGPQSTVWGEAGEANCDLCSSQTLGPGQAGQPALRAPTHPQMLLWCPS